MNSISGYKGVTFENNHLYIIGNNYKTKTGAVMMFGRDLKLIKFQKIE